MAGRKEKPGTLPGDTGGVTRIRLGLSYLGTNYVGWQVQAGALARDSIQGQLEAAIMRLAGEPVRVHGSGRTDSGVHAERQCAHFDMPTGRLNSIRDLRHAVNALLPRDIRVFEAKPCDPDFHARFSARSKTYRYLFWQDRGYVPPRLDPYVWCSGPLDIRRMHSSLMHLVGKHDFASLANAGTEEKGGTSRTLYILGLIERPVWPGCLPMIELSVTGSGFLKQMVRNMVGLLADIGRGRLAPDMVPKLLAQKSRESLPTPTAPAKGLTLVRVCYSDKELSALLTSGMAEAEGLFAARGRAYWSQVDRIQA